MANQRHNNKGPWSVVPALPPRSIDERAVAGAVLLSVSAAGGERVPATRVARDLAPYVSHRLSPSEWRASLDKALKRLERQNCLEVAAGRILPAPGLWPQRDELLGCRVQRGTPWHELRDIHLVALALGIEGEPRRRRALLESSGLRRAILERAFDMRFREQLSYAGLRDALARMALRRGLVSGDAALSAGSLSPAERRAQASNFLIDPKYGAKSDSRLIAVLAAERLGARGLGPTALRHELLRRHLSGEALGPAQALPPVRRFDLSEFLAEVRNFARQVAQGWQGNRRALISRVFPALAGAHPEWGLDVNHFKSLLADAHRAGRLSLINADLRDRGILAELQASAVAYHNMILHFIRVEDEASDAA